VYSKFAEVNDGGYRPRKRNYSSTIKFCLCYFSEVLLTFDVCCRGLESNPTFGKEVKARLRVERVDSGNPNREEVKQLKRLIVLAMAAALLVPATASAYEVIIPFFNDSAVDALASGDAGFGTFVQVVNLTEETLLLGIRYTDSDGRNATPAGNTFEISPLASWGFRPIAENSFAERAVALGGPRPPLPEEDTDGDGVGDGTATTFAVNTENRGGGYGGLAIFVLPPSGPGGSLTEYSSYDEALWAETPPIYLSQTVYNMYTAFDGVPNAMTGGITGPVGVD